MSTEFSNDVLICPDSSSESEREGERVRIDFARRIFKVLGTLPIEKLSTDYFPVEGG